MTVNIRLLTAADADSYVRMWSNFAGYLRNLGDTDEQGMTREKFLRDGFGADPAFAGFIAEIDGKPQGYLLYHFGYDVDRAIRILHVADLWVEPAARRHGVGRALMAAAAEQANRKGAPELIWAVFKPNKLAVEFYERLGAEYFRELAFMHIAARDMTGG
jgi:GNAT superfamily N-acetyltransferase